MKKKIEIIRPGTKVFLHDDLEAVVTAVNIRDGVQYQVSWIHGGDRKSEWVEPCEVDIRNGEKTSSVGFRP